MENYYLVSSLTKWEIQSRYCFKNHQGAFHTLIVDLPQGEHEFKIATTSTSEDKDFGIDEDRAEIETNQLTPLKSGGNPFVLKLQQSGIYFLQLDFSQTETSPSLVIEPKHLNAQNTHEADQYSMGLEHFLEMELPVRFEVGRSKMLIGDVMSLGQGSVIELDRLVGEDLNVYVADKLVAVGEVVVVNEQFGVRILKVLSPDLQNNLFA